MRTRLMSSGTAGKILDLLRGGGEYLCSRGVEEPSLASELLLSHTLGLSRADLLLSLDRSVGSDDSDRFWGFLVRGGLREPIQYITGIAHWFNFDVLVKRGVFIPRPETETLVEAVINCFQMRRDGDRNLSILDIGTGSGNIAVGLAKQLPNATVYASDISLSALILARENSRRNGVAERVHFLQGDLLKPFKLRKGADLIVSNPPYVRTSELQDLEIEVKGWEPRWALDGGTDGLSMTRRLIEDSSSILKEMGVLAVEMGAGQWDEVKEIAASAGCFSGFEIVKDLNGKERVALMER